MEPKAFRKWISEMKSLGLANSDMDCASLLGVHKNTIVSLKEKGADHRTALACMALLHRMPPYGEH